MDGDSVFLTGATGFVGGHVLDALLTAGYRVRALVRDPLSDGAARIRGIAGCVVVTGELPAAGGLTDALRGCRYLVHVAALYSFTPRDRAAAARVNVAGTRNLLEAARAAGLERALVTSSSSAVGPARAGVPATEESWEENASSLSAYHRSKVLEERAAFRAQIPVVTILPTAPVGPGDARPTPTGQMVVDLMRGRIRATLDGGLNLVPVEDIARAHVLALQRGRPGERYLTGADNLPLSEVWALIAEHAAMRAPRLRLPFGAALALAWADEARCRALPRTTPRVPIEGVRMARHHMYVSSEKAAIELGWRPGPVAGAVARAVAWFRDNGYAS